jgi:hypothetical protein
MAVKDWELKNSSYSQRLIRNMPKNLNAKS